MKNDMPKVKNIVIDEFVIDNPNEKQPFMIKGVELKYKKNKEGKGFYELSLDGKKIGVLAGHKKVILSERYLLELREFDEKYFEKIGLDGTLDSIVSGTDSTASETSSTTSEWLGASGI